MAFTRKLNLCSVWLSRCQSVFKVNFFHTQVPTPIPSRLPSAPGSRPFPIPPHSGLPARPPIPSPSLRCNSPPLPPGWLRQRLRKRPAPASSPSRFADQFHETRFAIPWVVEVRFRGVEAGWFRKLHKRQPPPKRVSAIADKWSRCPARSAAPAIARCIQPGVGRGSSCDASQSSPFSPATSLDSAHR
jgi:hypothetical protein